MRSLVTSKLIFKPLKIMTRMLQPVNVLKITISCFGFSTQLSSDANVK